MSTTKKPAAYSPHSKTPSEREFDRWLEELTGATSHVKVEIERTGQMFVDWSLCINLVHQGTGARFFYADEWQQSSRLKNNAFDMRREWTFARALTVASAWILMQDALKSDE